MAAVFTPDEVPVIKPGPSCFCKHERRAMHIRRNGSTLNSTAGSYIPPLPSRRDHQEPSHQERHRFGEGEAFHKGKTITRMSATIFPLDPPARRVHSRYVSDL